ncbi:MAG: aminoacyl-histidine dipeptidase [Saprospiraceae bacterium]|nr:aminoacyl-histidine dipeptidase [Saprospiraceae bacterium]
MNTQKINELEPKAIWENFAALNAIPRASKKEEGIRAFMIEFANKRGLEVATDKVGNVLIKKQASAGMENKQTVVLQAHLDMVHQKNNDTQFDFEIEGIDMYLDGDWVKARGTTLGADNGLGVAAIMGILSTDTIQHPPLEALFTIDEETGMTGALGLEAGFIQGKLLLNLDTEDDDELDIGCAGGMDVTATMKYNQVMCPAIHVGLKLTINGLKGGHSGMDIHLGLGNANKLMNRFLYLLCPEHGVMVSSINGGGLRNAIPRESIAVMSVHPDLEARVRADFEILKSEIIAEYKMAEPNLKISLESVSGPEKAADPLVEMAIIKAIAGAANGVYRMSPGMPDLVEASNNVARVEVNAGQAKIMCLTRSSVESTKLEVANSLKAVFELAGFDCQFSGSYPGWSPNPLSGLLELMKNQYAQLFGMEPRVVACHAGLECGIIGSHYPGMEMISFGPTIKGAHSPDERASVSSSQKFWSLLLQTLSNIPDVRA